MRENLPRERESGTEMAGWTRGACMHVCAQLGPTLCDPVAEAHQAPLSKEFSRQEHWSRLPFPKSEDLTHPGIEAASLASSALGRWILLPLYHLAMFPSYGKLTVPTSGNISKFVWRWAVAIGFFFPWSFDSIHINKMWRNVFRDFYKKIPFLKWSLKKK